ncbi:haemagglutinin [Burkholderia pseudomallei]|uniref:tRNA nuclease effector CdiA-2 n=1 Tax=Burkholderia pseudomallei TaxID=28450 RepID=UPI000977B671|nr:tRNA nuclease effector CdiA-2 [Burkholderia pseudomallei]MBD2918888.1 filamentous hemagglutinin N-terminal domain-containing protein [Burkholderia pseudomallei]MBD2998225.1 filamentous hemagglutinin N-terminal domain-containing protein [Burkholderia pseudomallei]MXP97261.1 filamentous hemagglutinin N-terminal domain-containing protein [Burkholderia pseudomallei]MXQ35194.1 filamentous hemagglutinin N-terminal domain-containing protein [Burkholderia pseudomallei]OMV26197.1 cell surface protei
MNKNRYRVVFNRARGALMVVQENGRASHGSGSRDARAGVVPAWLSLSPFALRHVALAVLVAAGVVPIWVNAQVVAGGAHAPSVIQTQNGLQQVNINRPGASGVSMNTYNQFDVPKPGIILNNSPINVQTQLGGIIGGNPNFQAGDAARLIVNQVNSNNPSFIRGKVEIGGAAAQLVIANQAGLVVDGGGFLNTSRATLTTGNPNFGPDGSLTGFNVNQGLISVVGAGLDTANVDQVDLLARAVQINAKAYAKTLNVVAGSNQVDYNTLNATPIAANGPAPTIAIDVSQLGGMYANRVFLVSSENGVGVANAGDIAAQAGDLTLQANGRLVLSGHTNAAGNMSLSASGGIQNSGVTYGKQSVTITTGADLTNSGALTAQQNLTANVGSLNSTGTLGAGINVDSTVGTSGDLNVTSSGQLTATGTNSAAGNATFTSSGVNLSNSATAANGNLALSATAGDVNLAGSTVSAKGAVNAQASGTVINDRGNLSSGAGMTLGGGSLSNQGGRANSQGPLSVQMAGTVSNQNGMLSSQSTADVRGSAIQNNAGLIQSAGKQTIAGASIDNSAGRLISLNADGLSVTATGALTNAAGANVSGDPGGVIGGKGDVTVQGNTVTNSGSMSADATLHVIGQSVDNGNGALHAGQTTTVDAGNHLSNAGGRVEGQSAVLNGATLDNSQGTVNAATVSLNGTTLLNHGGTVTQTGTGPMTVAITDTLDNSNNGLIQTRSTDLSLTSTTLINDNGGTITHVGPGTLTVGNGSGTVSNKAGAIASNGRTVLQGKTIDNSAGSASGQTGLSVNAADSITNLGGKLTSNANVDVTAGGALVNDGGELGSKTAATTIHSASLSNLNGKIVSPTLTATVAGLLDNSQNGDFEANQLALTAANLKSQGGHISQWQSGPTTLAVSGTLDNSNGGVIQTNSTDLTLAPAVLDNSKGTITHGGTGTLTLTPGNGAGALQNTGGTIGTNGQAIVKAGSLDNGSGVIAAKLGLSATIAGAMNNTQGLMRSNAALSIISNGALSNHQGHIEAGTPGDTSTLSIQAASIDNTDGAVHDFGTGKMTVQGGSQIVNSHAGGVDGMGQMTGQGDVTIGAASISNTQGGQLMGANLLIQGATLDNSGGQVGNVANATGDVNVAMSGAVTNTNGSITSTRDLSVAASTLLGGGAYSAARDAAINLQGDFTTTPQTQFNIGRDLTFTLPGTFANSANLQSVHNLTVNAGNIVNTGAMTAGSLLSTHSGDLTNYGAMVGGSVAIQASGTVSNLGPVALIGASDTSGLLEIVAHDIENRDDTTLGDSMPTTTIFGLGKVALAGGKDANGNYTNAALINNSSAAIQSGASMELHADKVTNTRRVMQTSGNTSQVDPALLQQLGISMSGCAAYYIEACSGQDVHWINLFHDPNYPDYDPAPIIAALKLQPGGVFTVPPNGGQWNSGYQYTTYEGKATANTVTKLSPGAQIASGGDLDASTVKTFQNYWSSVTAAGNIKQPASLDMDGWGATGQQAPGVTVVYSGYYHYNNYDNSEHNWTLPFGDKPFVGGPGGYTQAAPADVRQYSLPDYRSTWGANGTISGNGVSVNNTAANATIPSLGLLPGQAVPGLTIGTVSGNASGTQSGAAAIKGGTPTWVDPVIASATAVNVLSNLTIPQGGLYRPNSAPNPTYLIETNPAFTRMNNFLSSDYYLNQIGVNPLTTEKRLGDGFYEQQLVRNQVTQLTGKAVLGPYTDLQGMYQSLMLAGAELSKSLNLPLGMSLSAQQVAALTTNVIIMQTETVGGQQVLVPVVYLAKADQQNANGPLITAGNIDLKNTQVFTNSGTVKADTTLALQGKQIDNAFGALQSGGLTSLDTTGNVDLTSANVKAGSLDLNAGNKLILDTATQTTHQVSRDGATSDKTTLGPAANLNVAGDASIKTGGDFQQNAGNLSVGGNLNANIGGNWNLGVQQTGEHKVVQRANGVSDTDLNSATGSTVNVGGKSAIGVGGDLTAQGARLDFGQGGTVAAKGNVTFGAASTTSTINANSSGDQGNRSYAETRHGADQALTGTTVKGGDTLNVVSGKDINVIGSTIDLKKGDANLLAAGDVNVGAATETHVYNSRETHSRSGVVSGTKIASSQDATSTVANGSLISADGVSIGSGKDINVQGSTVVGTHDVALNAAHDVNITTSQDTSQSSTTYQEQHSGLMSGGGLSFSVGNSKLAQQNQSSSVTNNASTVGSVDGNLTVNAGNTLHVKGSDLVAGKDVTGTAANIVVDSATDTTRQAQQQQTSKSGLTVGLSGSVGDAINNAISETQAARESAKDSNGRASALHSIAAAGDVAFGGLGAKALLDGAKGPQAPSIGVQVSVGSSHSSMQSSEDQTIQRGSSINAGGNAKLIATGNGTPKDGNITIAGSNVNAANVALIANNQVNLVNTTDTDKTQSSNSSSGSSVGVSIGTNGIGVSASMQRAHGDGNSDAAIQNNTHINASQTATIVSGGDTNVIGANVNANKVVADVGGNLNVASVQDTTVSAAHQSSAGGGFTISQTGGGASFSAQNGHADGNYAGVKEQAGIQAGSGGFDVTVRGNTDLKGAYIASTADASKNSLTTGTLTTSDIENHSHYSANSAGFSAGASVGVSTKAVGPSSVSGSGGVTPMVFQNDSGDQSATTKSAVSAGTINITKPGEQTQDVANLNRDTTNLNGTVSKTPDVQKMLSQQADTMNAAQAAGQTVSQAIGLYADHKRDAALDAADKAYKAGDLAGAQAALNEAKGWMEGGASRAELQMGGGALIGGLGGGSALTAIGGAAGAGTSSLLANQAEKISKSVGDTTGSSLVGNIAANVAATVGGALVGGSAGAAMASNVQLYNAGNDSNNQTSNDVFASLSKKVAQAIAMTADGKAGVWNGMVNVAGVIVNLPNGGPFASPGDPGYVSLDGLKKPYKSGTSIGPDAEFWTPVLATLGLGGKAAAGTGATTTSADAATVGNGALKTASGDLSAAGNAARTQPYGNGASASPSPGTATAGSSGANAQLPTANGGVAAAGTSSATNVGKVVIDGKIGGQLEARGWTQQEVQAVVNEGPVGTTMDNRSAGKTPDGLPRNDSASVYGSKSGYVVVNDRTGEVVQVSGKNDPGWIPDSRIKWK